MNRTKTKKLKADLIAILGRAPSGSEWRRFKRHGLAMSDRDFEKQRPAPEPKVAENTPSLSSLVLPRAYAPVKASRTTWQRFVDWILRRT